MLAAAAAALAMYFFVQKRRRTARAPSLPSARRVHVEAAPVAQASAANAVPAAVQLTEKTAGSNAATHMTAYS